jgi:hypothetical protein
MTSAGFFSVQHCDLLFETRVAAWQSCSRSKPNGGTSTRYVKTEGGLKVSRVPFQVDSSSARPDALLASNTEESVEGFSPRPDRAVNRGFH